jgi:hypothetical protein
MHVAQQGGIKMADGIESSKYPLRWNQPWGVLDMGDAPGYLGGPSVITGEAGTSDRGDVVMEAEIRMMHVEDGRGPRNEVIL